MKSSSFFIFSFLILLISTSAKSVAEPKIFFTSTDINVGIYRADLNGQNIVEILNEVQIGGAPRNIVIDDTDNKIYWILDFQNNIMRANIDGSGIEPFDIGLSQPLSLTIDPIHRNIFWTSTDGIIRKKPILGGAVEEQQPTSHIEIVAAPLYNLLITNNAPKNALFEQQLEPFDLNAVPSLTVNISNIALSVLHYSAKVVHGTDAPNRLLLSDIINPAMVNPIELFTYQDVTIQATATNYDESFVYYVLEGKVGRTLIGSGQQQDLIDDIQYAPVGLAVSCSALALDTDNDSRPDCADNCPNDGAKTVPGTCGCGVTEDDTDGDGTPNCNDLCPSDSLKSAPGSCGCGAAEDTVDSDSDGTINCHDQCPSDNLKTAPGQCGCGTPDSFFNNPISCQPVNTPTPEPTVTTAPTQTPAGIQTPVATAVPDIQVLSKDTKITEPPIVIVNKKTVKIFLLKFTKAIFNTKPTSTKRGLETEAANAPKITFRYKVNVKSKAQKIKNVYSLSSKKNVLTVKNLSPGNYTVNYQAEILKDGKQVGKTNLSPTATFTIE